MVGTIINIATVSAGSVLGVVLGNRFPQRIQEIVFDALGLLTLFIGFQMAFKTENVLIVLGALLAGGITGELLRIEDRLNRIGEFLQRTFSMEKQKKFVEGFVTASLLFCVGPMAILGSIRDGLTGDYTLLAIKSMLDGFASLGFASALGWGVLFSTLTILAFQGSITLSAAWIQKLLTASMVNEMTAAGGLIIVGIGIRLLKIRDIRVGNFLPALVIAPATVFILDQVKPWLEMVASIKYK
jgi:uncharacterized membrane protein YqgA involved in biofilm formation